MLCTQFYEYETDGYYFRFRLKEMWSGEVRIYIESQPGYGYLATDGHSTHRYYDEDEGHYVCVDDDLKPTNFTDAKDWARYWARGTVGYIQTGREFS